MNKVKELGTEMNIENAIYWYKKVVENGCLDVKETLDVLSKQQNNLNN